MIEKKFDDDWRWVPKMIIWQKYQQINPHESQVFIRDYKAVSSHWFRLADVMNMLFIQ